MRKKETWMKKGAPVMADGKRGVITKMEENMINDVVYVYYIDVMLDGQKFAGVYHPLDIKNIDVEVLP